MKTSLITAAILVTILVITMAGCTVAVNPDGSRSYSANAPEWLEITRLILADEIPQSPIAPTK